MSSNSAPAAEFLELVIAGGAIAAVLCIVVALSIIQRCKERQTAQNTPLLGGDILFTNEDDDDSGTEGLQNDPAAPSGHYQTPALGS